MARGIEAWAGAATVRKARMLARKAGHDMTSLKEGGTTAIASCRNPGCTVMLEIRGPDNWRFIRLGAPGETCSAAAGSATPEDDDG
jgi:hypothetical protein